MVLQVDRLIYVYMALCACLLFFNLVYTGRRRIQDIRNPFRIKWWYDYLEKIIGTERDTGPAELETLTKRMRHVSGLLAFQETVEKMRTEGKGKSVDNWLGRSRTVFVGLGSRYLKKSVMEKAFYAYVIWRNRLCGNQEQDVIVRYMLQLVSEHSIYCRENALQALYSSGSPSIVVKAYKKMMRSNISHSQKLLADGLVSFSGSKEELAEEFWRQWNYFSPHYQTAVINFMRLSVENWGEKFLPLLQEGTDREVQFAVLRYLRRYPYEKAAPVLQRMVREWDTDDWEFPALAALTLENYASRETVMALYEGMHSTSWYVRNNASDSLIKIGGEYEQMEKVIHGGDRYAAEMLQYKLERQKEEGRNDGCN